VSPYAWQRRLVGVKHVLKREGREATARGVKTM